MALKFRRGTTAQKSGSLAFGEPYVNTTLGTLQIGGESGDVTLLVNSASQGISGSSLNITGNAKVDGNLTLGGQLTIGDATSDTVNVVASLSSSLIPQTTNAFDLGSADKIWRDLYISTGSIKFVDNGSVVTTLNNNTISTLVTSTGSYASTGSNIFVEDQTITGSLVTSGSKVEFNVQWPTLGTEQHIVKTNGFTLDGREYDYAGIALTHYQSTPQILHNAIAMYMFDPTNTFGSELVVGPYRTHMQSYPSGSGGNTANISVQDLTDGRSQATIYGDIIQIGAFVGDTIAIGNSGSVTTISGSIVSSQMSQIQSATSSFESKFNTLQSVTSSLNTYTSSLNNAIQLTGSTVSFLGNIVVYGTQSIINSENLAVNDNLIYLNEGSTITNPDLGIVGNYNDGTYAHSGIFRDASDGGAWKVFEGYTLEPSGTIDTTGNGFTLADFKADAITATSFNGTINATNGVVSGSAQVKNLLPAGIVSGSSQVDVSLTTGDIALGTRTSGNYVASLVAGTNITLSNNTGEGATPTIALTNNTISGISLGSNLATLTIGTGLSGTSYNGSGAVTIANTGVTSITGTSNQVVASASTGGVTLSLPQSIATTSTPTFGNLTINGTITATGDITAFYTSDRRHKNNIQIIPNALDKVKQLNGVTWEWNDDVNEVTKSTPKTGLIAQEVQEVLPEVVTEREDGFLALDYSKMMGLLVEAIKEQQSTISKLESEVKQLADSIRVLQDNK